MPELHMKFIHSNRDTPREKTYVPGRLTEATKSDNVQMAGYLIGKDQKMINYHIVCCIKQLVTHLFGNANFRKKMDHSSFKTLGGPEGPGSLFLQGQ